MKKAFILALMLVALTAPAQAGENATYAARPAPWDGWVPALTLSHGDFSISANIREDEENNFAEGQSYTFKEIGLWNACKKDASPPCGFLTEGTVKLVRYSPRRYIEGSARIERIGDQLSSGGSLTMPSGFVGPVEFTFSADYKEGTGCPDCGPQAQQHD